MSYLHPVRVHFAGRFRADVSTVNNDVVHYASRVFDESFHKEGPGARLGWWNPSGTGTWRLAECTVTRACYADGSFSEDPAYDGAVSAHVADAGDRSSAKIVDLDPQQQTVSQLWGLQFRILEPKSGAILLKAEYRAAPFQQIWWGRQRGDSGDSAASAAYQAVLHDLEWGDLSASPALRAMKAASQQGQLSIKFSLDMYALRGPMKTYGRIVGTIGPYQSGEPEQLVLGRHLVPNDGDGYPMHHSVCVVDKQRRKITADFGNALPTDGDGLQDLGAVALGVVTDKGIVEIGRSSYRDPDWYRKTAGIEEFPKTAALTDDQLDAVERFPLVVVTSDDGGAPVILSPESPGQLYLRPDGNVFRLDPDESITTRLFVTMRGRPVADAEINCALYNGAFDTSAGNPPLGVPEDAIAFASTIRTGATGGATLTIQNNGFTAPPRGYIDGQLYGIAFELPDATKKQISTGTRLEPDNFISLLFFGRGQIPDQPTWTDVRPILQQYANLYPRPHGPRNYIGRDNIHSIFDLGRYEDVVRYGQYIVRALARPIEHADAMPVTRDLAAWKRDLIIVWLTTPGADGLPKRDLEKMVVVDSTAEARAEGDAAVNPGSKTLAALNSPALRAAAEPSAKPRSD